MTRPGLSEQEFKDLFAKCPCGLVMTRRSFKGHTCAQPQQGSGSQVIDLTWDSEDDIDVGMDSVIDLTTDSDFVIDLTSDADD
jgi:hypothetical protein